MTTRRSFVKKSGMAAGALLLGSMQGCGPNFVTTGSILGPDNKLGHLLRGGKTFPVAETYREDVVIVGGGVAGLSAGRWLHNVGVSFKLIEIEQEVGGNSRAGSMNAHTFPLGAHYLPIPSNRDKTLLAFLEEAGTVTGYKTHYPIYNEYHLCFDPKERLFINHHWQEGLIPHDGLPQQDADEINRFLELMHSMRIAEGADGKPAFTIPLHESSADEKYRSLDAITMADYLTQNNFSSEALKWYVNYCCADDFGSTIEETSAWAGIHYFASRKGNAANAGLDDVLTWPEGNAFLVNVLRKNIAEKIISRSVALSVVADGQKVLVDYFDGASQTLKRIEARAAILAVPTYVAKHLVREERKFDSTMFEYAPWMVANIAVESWLNERRGEQLSWDNVIYGSNSLGYVNAGQQNVNLSSKERVITYYRALTGKDCALTRKTAMQTTWEQWRDSVFADLKVPHPDLQPAARQLDVWIWGHGMIRPKPGLIWGPDRIAAQKPIGNKIFFAHSDLSGISIFEEAFHQGIRAAGELYLNA